MGKNSRQPSPKEELIVSGGVSEQGVVVGNTYDKYSSNNPLARHLVSGFSQALTGLVEIVNPKSIHEVGCGEGYWTLHWAQQGFQVKGSDFSEIVIGMARENARIRGIEGEIFQQLSIDDLDPAYDSAELVVCCEVLEHLGNPDRALRALRGAVSGHLILSVPREPVWSLMNMARGKYWGEFGNTPGHIQQWSQRSFTTLVARYFRILEVRAPLPWTMLLCAPGDKPD